MGRRIGQRVDDLQQFETDPGQPWVMRIGMALGCRERT